MSDDSAFGIDSQLTGSNGIKFGFSIKVDTFTRKPSSTQTEYLSYSLIG